MNQDAIFEIKIDFTSGEGDPARVFKAMSGLIDAMSILDSHLASSFDLSLDASLVLDRIETGSIRGFFRSIIDGIPDEAIRDGEWRKVVGHYLLRAKYTILKWLEEKPKISGRDDLRDLEEKLLTTAEETNLKQLPAYAIPRTELILSDILRITESLSALDESDIATYSYIDGSTKFNPHLDISKKIAIEILTKETIESVGQRIVKVKKPDYLGQSMWGLQYDGRAIEAKIDDSNWLLSFQSRQVEVRPGDSLKVRLYEEISYGYNGEIVHSNYVIEQVDEIITPSTQNKFDF